MTPGLCVSTLARSSTVTSSQFPAPHCLSASLSASVSASSNPVECFLFGPPGALPLALLAISSSLLENRGSLSHGPHGAGQEPFGAQDGNAAAFVRIEPGRLAGGGCSAVRIAVGE